MTAKEKRLLLALAEVAMLRYAAIKERQRHHVQDWNVAMVRAAEAVAKERFWG